MPAKKVIRVINGVKIRLDRHIANLICDMNRNGYPTLWCCSGVKADHGKNESERLYVRCDYTQYTPEMLDVMFECTTGIGSLEANRNSCGSFLDIEFKRDYIYAGDGKEKSPKNKINTFHKRFKELTNAKFKIQK
jgi:hypothetical protein